MVVKACGLRTLEELNWAYELGYNLFGIVVDPKSKRYVPDAEQLYLRLAMPECCVLVARQWQHLMQYARLCPQALLQCYEPFPDFVPKERRLMPVNGEKQWQLCQARQSAAYYLYDVSLGSGEWQGLPEWCCGKDQLLSAGGLNSESLKELAQHKRHLGTQRLDSTYYFGFDLSSGLESTDDQHSRSRKDYHKMRECIDIIRNSLQQQ